MIISQIQTLFFPELFSLIAASALFCENRSIQVKQAVQFSEVMNRNIRQSGLSHPEQKVFLSFDTFP
jgi:hypothetical protein